MRFFCTIYVLVTLCFVAALMMDLMDQSVQLPQRSRLCSYRPDCLEGTAWCRGPLIKIMNDSCASDFLELSSP